MMKGFTVQIYTKIFNIIVQISLKIASQDKHMEVGHQAYGTYYTKQRLSSCVIQRKCQQHLKLLMSRLYTFINVNFKR